MNNVEDKKCACKFFIAGGIVGGIVGLTTALLIAPKSGKDLRNNIKGKTAQLSDTSAEIVTTAREKVVPVVKNLSEQSHNVKEKVMEFVSNIKENNQK